eukprot:gene9890-12132_t
MSESESTIKHSKIYTKTGDKGTSSLFNGERKLKNDSFFHALGTIDELSASMGVALEYSIIDSNGLEEYLERIISLMLDLGACVAVPLDNSKDSIIERTKFDESHTKKLEEWIDLLDSQLPPLKNFIIPARVGLCATNLHLARAICRRAEREIVCLTHHKVIPDSVGVYINRLSDFLFVSARYAAMKLGKDESLKVFPRKSTTTNNN